MIDFENIFPKIEDKQRILIAGSYGQEQMLHHITGILKYLDRSFDVIKSNTTPLLTDSPIVLIEGSDELFQNKANFMDAQHHILLLTHIKNDAFHDSELDEYVSRYEKLADATPKAGLIIYNEEDELNTTVVCQKERADVRYIEYNIPKYFIREGKFYLIGNDREIKVEATAEKYLINYSGALALLKNLGVNEDQYYEALQNKQ